MWNNNTNNAGNKLGFYVQIVKLYGKLYMPLYALLQHLIAETYSKCLTIEHVANANPINKSLAYRIPVQNLSRIISLLRILPKPCEIWTN